MGSVGLAPDVAELVPTPDWGSAVTGLFTTCLQRFGTFSSSIVHNTDSKLPICKLEVEQILLLRWGQSLGIAPGGLERYDERLDDDRVRSVAIRVLASLQGVFENQESLLITRYGLTPRGYDSTSGQYLWHIQDQTRFELLATEIMEFVGCLTRLLPISRIQQQLPQAEVAVGGAGTSAVATGSDGPRGRQSLALGLALEDTGSQIAGSGGESQPVATVSTSAVPPPRKGTGIAFTSWPSEPDPKDTDFQLFYQSNSGKLWGMSWSEAGPERSPHYFLLDSPQITAKHGTPLAQVQLSTPSRGREVHLFYINPEGIICDAIYANGRVLGGSLGTKGFLAGKDSKLAAIVFNNTTEIRIYFQDSNGFLTELIWVNGGCTWVDLELTTAKGAGIAAVHYFNNRGYFLLIFTQTPDGVIVRKVYHNGVWHGPFVICALEDTYLGTSITAVTVNSGDRAQGDCIRRLFWTRRGGYVQELCVVSSTWGVSPTDVVMPREGGSIAAAVWGLDGARLVYEQEGDSKLCEVALKTKGAAWVKTGFKI